MYCNALGSKSEAEALVRRAASVVPAYREFLAKHRCTAQTAFDDLPLTDKKNYISACEFGDLLADDYDRTFTIFASSRSSGQSFYWPQLKTSHQHFQAACRQFLVIALQSISKPRRPFRTKGLQVP